MEELSDAGSIPASSTRLCFDEHLSIKVFKTRLYLICGIYERCKEESLDFGFNALC